MLLVLLVLPTLLVLLVLLVLPTLLALLARRSPTLRGARGAAPAPIRAHRATP